MNTLLETTNFLDKIEEGMRVYDAYGMKVGRVKDIWYPVRTPVINVDEDFPYSINNQNMPEIAAYRLMRQGFVSVDAGILAKDRLVLPEQIAVVIQDEVHLHVNYAELITA